MKNIREIVGILSGCISILCLFYFFIMLIVVSVAKPDPDWNKFIYGSIYLGISYLVTSFVFWLMLPNKSKVDS